MKLRALLLVLVGLTTQGPLAQSESVATSTLTEALASTRRWDGEFHFVLGAATLEEGKDQGGAAVFLADAKFQYRYSTWLRARINPRISMFSARLQERYDDDAFEGRLWLADAFIATDIGEHFEFRAGALNQKYHGSSAFISSLRSFPGIQEIAKAKLGSVNASLIFQQAVPTSHSLNTEREREEELPTFITETLALSGKSFGLIEWEFAGGYFKWNDLPAKVSAESRLIGNVGTGELTPNSKFSYGHEGWYAGGEACLFCENKIGLVLEFTRFQNTTAPGDSADAQIAGIGPHLMFRDFTVDFRYRRYFIESDATIAYYNKSRLGNTNRIGDNFEAHVRFPKEQFGVFAEVYNSQPINYDLNQRDLNVFVIGVETDYVKF